jgi:hypothetical protein
MFVFRSANGFFHYLHVGQLGLKLTALVVHCSVDDTTFYVRMDEHILDEHEFSPQHCYMQGFNTDVFGDSAAVAIPVARAKVRQVKLHARTLCKDPELVTKAPQCR